MKILKKIIATMLALLLSTSYLVGGYTNIEISSTRLAYADSAVDSQREQLKLAVDDKDYVRGTQSYKNAAKKDVDAYESAISAGENLLSKNSASGQELYQATKDIDLAAKYLTKSANILVIKATIERNENKIAGLDYIRNNMPNAYKRYKNELNRAIKAVNAAIARAKQYIAKNER